MNALLKVETPGFLTTVQDLGRIGYSAMGVPVCGAMDAYALQCANMLAGAPRSAAGLEITLIGPRLSAIADCRIAVAGSDLGAMVDGEPLLPWRSAVLRAGRRLTFRRARESRGARSYLAVNGGLDVPMVLRSRSTCLAAGFGGKEGRALRAGDELAAFPAIPTREGCALSSELIPPYEQEPTLRLVPGPEFTRFTAGSRRRFLSSAYAVNRTSNRTGYRLDGPSLSFRHGHGADIATEAALFGTVQITSDGTPLLLMADHQVTGGYARLGTVIAADLPLAAQLAPGDTVRFQPCDAPEAERLAIEQRRALRLLESVLLWQST